MVRVNIIEVTQNKDNVPCAHLEICCAETGREREGWLCPHIVTFRVFEKYHDIINDLKLGDDFAGFPSHAICTKYAIKQNLLSHAYLATSAWTNGVYVTVPDIMNGETDYDRKWKHFIDLTYKCLIERIETK